jgi:hypothetical protein
MGRFYKTAKPQNLDYAFRFPTHLLAAAVAKKDREINETMDEAEKLSTYVNEQKNKTKSSIGRGLYLPGDSENYENEVSGFEQEIDAVTKSIVDNPFQSYKQKGGIRDIRSRITSSLSTGNLHTFNKNFNTAKEWLDKNKDISTPLKNRAYQQAVDKWKGSIKDDGNYNDLSNFLPPVLYDADVKETALEYAGKTEKTRNVNIRAGLIATNLIDDENITSTVWQKLEYGLLTDATGKVIDPVGLTPEEKSQIVKEDIISTATNAANLTQHTPKVDKPRNVKEGDKSYMGTGSTSNKAGTGLTQNTQIANIKNRYPEAKTLSEAIVFENSRLDTILANPDLSGANQVKYTIEKGLLENKVANAHDYAVKQIEKAKQTMSFRPNIDQRPDQLSDDMLNAMFVKYTDEYLAKADTQKIVDATAQWSKNFTKNEQKQVVEDVKTIINDESLFNDKVLKSSRLEIDGQSFQTMLENGGIKPNITNESKKTDAIIAAKEESLPGQENNVVAEVSSDGKQWIVKYVDIEGNNAQLDPVDIKYGEGYSNFKLTTSEPIPTKNMDDQGNTMFRIGAMYKGKDDKIMKPTSLYVSSADIGSSTYDEVLHRRQQDGSSLYYDNYGITLYNNLVSEIQVGDEVPIVDNVVAKMTKQGLQIIEGTETIASSPAGVKAYLKSIVTPKN